MSAQANNAQPMFGMRNHPPTFRKSVPMADIEQMPDELAKALAGAPTLAEQDAAAEWIDRSVAVMRKRYLHTLDGPPVESAANYTSEFDDFNGGF